MVRCIHRVFVVVVLTASLPSCVTRNIAALSSPRTQQSLVQANGTSLHITVEPANDWSELLRRSSGWSGADGIYAIPLNGYEGPGRAAETATLFVFGDTLIGKVSPRTLVRSNCVMVNNTLAVLEGGMPDPAKIHFIQGTDDGAPAAVFRPDTPRARAASARTWYWLQDGICLGDRVYILATLVKGNPDGPPGFQFRGIGVSLVTVPVVDGTLDLPHQTQADTPLFHRNSKRTVFFGAGILASTKSSGAPNPDGFIYIYGRYEAPDGLQLAVARVMPDSFEDFSQWRFRSATGWSDNIDDSISLGPGGPELSVVPVSEGPLKGQYLLCSMCIERDLFIRVGEAPEGPFGPRINIFRTEEPQADPEIYTYNAKIHPSLSTTDELLLTYNVNTTNWSKNIRNADIYRPRFLRLRILAPGS